MFKYAQTQGIFNAILVNAHYRRVDMRAIILAVIVAALTFFTSESSAEAQLQLANTFYVFDQIFFAAILCAAVAGIISFILLIALIAERKRRQEAEAKAAEEALRAKNAFRDGEDFAHSIWEGGEEY